jgi:hypothetical protein
MSRNGTVDRVESAANINLIISKPGVTNVTYAAGSFSTEDADENDDTQKQAGFIEIPISRLDTTKDVEISEIRENTLKASGYSITSISYSGTMMFKGSNTTKTYINADDNSVSKSITDFLYDEHGVPQPVLINIGHELEPGGDSEVYKQVLATSESYEVRSEEATETAFDWVAMDRSSDQK